LASTEPGAIHYLVLGWDRQGRRRRFEAVRICAYSPGRLSPDSSLSVLGPRRRHARLLEAQHGGDGLLSVNGHWPV